MLARNPYENRPDFRQDKVNALIDDYIARLADPDQSFYRVASRTALEFELVKHGITPTSRGLALGESHAIWYACLIATKRVRQVSRLEIAKYRKMGNGRNPRPTRTTEKTVKNLLHGRDRQTCVGRIITQVLEGNGLKSL